MDSNETASPSTVNFTTPASSMTSANGSDVIPEGCIIPQFSNTDFIPWNNPYDRVTLEMVTKLAYYKAVVAVPVLFVIGFPANVVNMIIFGKLGLRDRINLVLFALALCDLVVISYYELLYVERLFDPNVRYGLVFQALVRFKLMGLVGFVTASQFLSALVAVERCFCVLSPIKAKTVLATRTMAIIIIVGIAILVGFCFVIAFRYKIGCFYNPITKSAMLTPVATDEVPPEFARILEDFVVSIILTVTFTTIVMAMTVVTCIKLRQVFLWRSFSIATAASAREMALTRMLVLTSFLFLFCYLPTFAWRLVCLANPMYNIGQLYNNSYQLMMSVVEILAMVNSSTKFFIYLAMGSRFKRAFFGLFCPSACVKFFYGMKTSDISPGITEPRVYVAKSQTDVSIQTAVDNVSEY